MPWRSDRATRNETDGKPRNPGDIHCIPSGASCFSDPGTLAQYGVIGGRHCWETPGTVSALRWALPSAAVQQRREAVWVPGGDSDNR